ncbi:MAG: homoserine dehydrogenase, partial [Candidatus Korobacteraceae bacterium]
MQTVRVGIVGFGTVGRATADIIAHHAPLIQKRSGVQLVVTAICRRQPVKAAEIPAGARVTTAWTDLLTSDDVDVIVETMGGVDHSLQLLRGALEHGKPVVTANKKLLAEHGDELFA